MHIVGASLQSICGLLEFWEWEALVRMVVCVLIGGVIGIERELHGRPAGIRTHSLVCLGCGVVMLVSIHFPRMYADLSAVGVVRLDPARLAYGVLTGIGFLGAGVIMKEGGSVHGLTTAASLWGVSALGLAVGVGMYVVAAVGTALMFASLLIMRQLGPTIQPHHYRLLRVTHKDTAEVARLQAELEAAGAKVLDTTLDDQRAAGLIVATYQLRFVGEKTALEVYEMLAGCGPFDRLEIE